MAEPTKLQQKGDGRLVSECNLIHLQTQGTRPAELDQCQVCDLRHFGCVPWLLFDLGQSYLLNLSDEASVASGLGDDGDEQKAENSNSEPEPGPGPEPGRV